jgi:hypothetical protein
VVSEPEEVEEEVVMLEVVVILVDRDHLYRLPSSFDCLVDAAS